MKPVQLDLFEDVLNDPAHAVADPLHPTGRCTCAGEGTCTWCKSTCYLCGVHEPVKGDPPLCESCTADINSHFPGTP